MRVHPEAVQVLAVACARPCFEWPLVYDELRKLAAVRLASEKPGQTIQATALVHEAYQTLRGRLESVSGFSENRMTLTPISFCLLELPKG